MAAFCWMLVEGIYFYLLIVKVYNISNRLIVYHVMAWGILLLSIMNFIIVRADLPYFESIYCWYDLTLTSPSLCVKVSPSLWSALLSASQLEKEGFKATSAINSKKQSFRSLYLLFSFLSMFWFISDLGFLFKKKKKNHVYLSFVLLKPVFLLFLRTCSFPLSFFLLHSFSAFKYHISYHFNSLFLFR